MKGFTLVELLIVVSITLVLAVSAGAIYSNFYTGSQLNESVTLLIQTLRQARQNSVSRYNNANYGIRLFEESSYVLYQGDSYALRDPAYDRVITLDDAVTLSWSLTSGDDINFSKSLGIPNITGIVTLSHSIGDFSRISINSLGIVEQD